jgi:zinc protease
MAAGVLDGGNSARLESRLVRGQQIAASIGASYDPYSRLPSLFMLQGTPVAGKTPAELKQALLEQIRLLQTELVAQEELERVKAQVQASKVYERDSIFYQAMQMGTAETVGLGWRKTDEYLEKISAVTPEQIRQAARKYLVEDRLTLGFLDPQPIPEGQPAPEDRAPVGGQHVR